MNIPFRFILLSYAFLFLSLAAKSQTQTFESYFKAGLDKLEKKDYAGAVVEFTIAIEIEPRKKGYLYLAHTKQKIQDFEGAIKVYNDLIAFEPNNAEAFNNRGNLKDNLLRPAEAIEDYNQAILIKSDYTEAYFNRAIAFYNFKDFEAAKLDFQKVLELDPDDAESLLGLGLTEKQLGNSIQACKYLLEAQRAGLDEAQKYWEEFCRNGID